MRFMNSPISAAGPVTDNAFGRAISYAETIATTGTFAQALPVRIQAPNFGCPRREHDRPGEHLTAAVPISLLCRLPYCTNVVEDLPRAKPALASQLRWPGNHLISPDYKPSDDDGKSGRVS